MSDSICIIPARGGSRRILGKNMAPFKGKPMLQYAIEAARKSRQFHYRGIWVSTDSTQIAELTYSLGALVIMRPDELAVDEVGTQQVMRHAIHTLGMHRRDIACCLYPCSPLLAVEDLILGHDLLAVQGTQYAMSVGTDPLCDAGNFYWGYAGAFMDDLSLIAPHTAMVPIDKSRVCDINTPEDWLRAETLFDNLKEK